MSISYSSRPHLSKRRTALSPPTVIPPSLNHDNPSATKPVPISGSHVRASSLLARVASTPPSPRLSSLMTSPLPSPPPRDHMERRMSTKSVSGHQGSQRPPMMRFATMPNLNTQSDGYVSFPDFDLFCQEQKSSSASSSPTDQTGAGEVRT